MDHSPHTSPDTSAQRRARAERERALCALAKAGDAGAMEGLIERYQPRIRAIAAGYFLPGGERDDLQQEGMIGLVQAIRGYEPDRGIPFHHFAEMCITRQVMGAVRRATRGKHAILSDSLSLERPTPDGVTLADALDGPMSDGPERQAIAHEGVQVLARAAGECLTELEAQVLVLLLEDLTHAEIAERVDRSVKAIDNALQRIRRKVGARLLEWDPAAATIPAPRRS